MIHSKSQNKWRMAGKRSLLLLAVLSLVITMLGLPLYAQTAQLNSPAGRMVDDVKEGARDLGRGVRNFGRDVRDAVDPDHDGILPDGSIDNGIAGDGNQFDDEHNNQNGNMTGNVTSGITGTIPDTPETSGTLDEVRPDVTGEPSRPSPDQSGNATDNMTGDATDRVPDGTSSGASTTDKPATTSDTHADNTDNADGKTEGGFRWTGLIIALVIAAAVIALICLLIPRNKHK